MLALHLWLSLAALAAPYRPEALDQIEQSVREANHQSVVVFDLDDTLIDTRARTLRILRDFAASAGLAGRYPSETKKISRLTKDGIRYDLKDTFSGIGLDNARLLAEALAYWKPRFFSDAYLAEDDATASASHYVSALWEDGATIVYLTGRDIPHMRRGTTESLHRLGFPLGAHVVLLMKPQPEMSDLDFKRSAIQVIQELGVVEGVFENEPANLNLLHEAFPGAGAVFLDTRHSAKPDCPFPGAAWVRDFR